MFCECVCVVCVCHCVKLSLCDSECVCCFFFIETRGEAACLYMDGDEKGFTAAKKAVVP